MLLNRVLDDTARVEYAPAIEELEQLAPEIFAKKLERANVQQAFVFQTIKDLLPSSCFLLNGGGYDDTAGVALNALGYQTVDIDPAINDMTVEQFIELNPQVLFDSAFATSVIEHVVEDEKFIEALGQNVRSGGYLILTFDFKREYQVGDPNCPTTSFRFYSLEGIARIKAVLARIGYSIYGEEDYSGAQDFTWENHWYAFGTLVAKKA